MLSISKGILWVDFRMGRGQSTVVVLVYLFLGLLVFAGLTPVVQAEISSVLPQVDNLTALLLSYFTGAAFFVMCIGIFNSLKPVREGYG